MELVRPKELLVILLELIDPHNRSPSRRERLPSPSLTQRKDVAARAEKSEDVVSKGAPALQSEAAEDCSSSERDEREPSRKWRNAVTRRSASKFPSHALRQRAQIRFLFSYSHVDRAKHSRGIHCYWHFDRRDRQAKVSYSSPSPTRFELKLTGVVSLQASRISQRSLPWCSCLERDLQVSNLPSS